MEIGNYIHWRTYNYKFYGTSPNTGKPGDKNAGLKNAITVHNFIHNKLINLYQNNANDEQAKILEDLLNNTANTEEFSKTYDNNYDNLSVAEKAIVDYLHTIYDDFIADFSTGGISKTDLMSMTASKAKQLAKRYYRKEDVNKDQTMYVSTIRDRIIHLQNARDYIFNVINSSNGQLEDDEVKKLNLTNIKINKILDELIAIADNAEAKGLTKLAYNKGNIKGVRRGRGNTKRTLADVMKSMNKVISNISIPSSLILGDMGEAYIASIMLRLAGATTEVVGDFLENLKTSVAPGKEKATTTLTFDDSLKEFLIKNKTFASWTKHDSDGGGYTVTNKTQQTTDISVELKDGSKLADALGLNKLNASIKNYDGLSHINILRNYSFLEAVAFNSSYFANHYFNIITHAQEPKVGFLQNVYDHDVRLSVGIRGLLGSRSYNDSKTTKSDFLIINDNSGNKENHIHVYPTKKILERLDDVNNNSIAYYKDMRVSISGINKVNKDKIIAANTRHKEGPAARIAEIISIAHQQKISLSISNKM